MSYVVEILRPISVADLERLAAEDAELTLIDGGDGWTNVAWRRGSEESTLTLAQGRIALTSPSDAALDKAREIAHRLNAVVVGEDEQVPLRMGANTTPVRGGWIGWPVLTAALTALLVWKW